VREARRLALLRQQSLIAEVARKQSLRTLAEALDAEARSRALAVRSRALTGAAAPQAGVTTGEGLRARAGFTAGLAQLALTAEDAARDAARQCAWQADSLALAETRARRLADRTREARAALAAAQARAEAARELPLARKLQNRSTTSREDD
jgi:hypothetical protein